jgi:hypothetical protein
VSWNGDTEVVRWQVLAGGRSGALQPLAAAPRSAFETAIEIAGQPQRLAVRGLDARGRVLATSATIAL